MLVQFHHSSEQRQGNTRLVKAINFPLASKPPCKPHVRYREKAFTDALVVTKPFSRNVITRPLHGATLFCADFKSLSLSDLGSMNLSTRGYSYVRTDKFNNVCFMNNSRSCVQLLSESYRSVQQAVCSHSCSNARGLKPHFDFPKYL